MVVHFSILAWRIPLAGDTFYSPWGCKELNTAQWLSTDISHSYIFLEKCLFKSFAHFWIGWLFLFLLRFWSSLYILDIIFYQVFSWQILSPILWVALLLCWQCLLMQKIKNFPEVLCLFSYIVCDFDVGSKKLLPNPMLWSFCPLFFSKKFIVLGLAYRSLIHLS